MFTRILVPMDGSRFGTRALRYAEDVARRFGAEIVLLQVVQRTIPIPASSGLTPGLDSPEATEVALEAAAEEDKRNLSHAKRYLSGKARALKKRGINVSYRAVAGYPADSIMVFARRQRIDLIVMATHGKSGFRRAIMGSVADKVIRESGKPVLVVRPKSR